MCALGVRAASAPPPLLTSLQLEKTPPDILQLGEAAKAQPHSGILLHDTGDLRVHTRSRGRHTWEGSREGPGAVTCSEQNFLQDQGQGRAENEGFGEHPTPDGAD